MLGDRLPGLDDIKLRSKEHHGLGGTVLEIHVTEREHRRVSRPPWDRPDSRTKPIPQRGDGCHREGSIREEANASQFVWKHLERITRFAREHDPDGVLVLRAARALAGEQRSDDLPLRLGELTLAGLDSREVTLRDIERAGEVRLLKAGIVAELPYQDTLVHSLRFYQVDRRNDSPPPRADLDRPRRGTARQHD